MAGAADILIVGGYGVVGRRVAARLAPEFPGRVMIAGRSDQAAAELCRELGQGTKPRRIDGPARASFSALGYPPGFRT